MNIEAIILNAFPEVSVQDKVTDSYISGHQNLMEMAEEIERLVYVPAYMLWCIRNVDNYDQLVTYFTVGAIAEYGRAKNSANNYLNFKYRCNTEQRKAVLAFLRWCQEYVDFLDEQQIERAIKRWEIGVREGRWDEQ